MAIFEERHYQAIARVIAWRRSKLFGSVSHELLAEVVGDLCEVFTIDDPNFEKEKFLKACGMEGKGHAGG